MLESLFKGNENVYHAQYADFLRQIEYGQIGEIVLAGYQSKGFFIIGRIKSPAVEIQCVLVNQRSDIRFIKCPDNAHALLYNMGVYEFEIDATAWDMDSAFNPHKVSHESRQRKKRREDALRHRPIYLDKYRFAYNDVQIDERIKQLVECAIQQGWVDEGKEITKKRFFTWFDKRDLPDNKKVPAWAMKSATLLATDQGVYPRNDIEMSTFACLWFSIHCPFKDYEDVKKSLPDDFISSVVAAGVSFDWIETVFNDEILHARHVERKEQVYLEEKEIDSGN
jgi:hypothetical protein